MRSKSKPKPLGKRLIVLLGKHLRRRVEPMPDVVAIEQVRVSAQFVQLLLHQVGDRAFARTRQASEPKDAAGMAMAPFAIGTHDRWGVPNNFWLIRWGGHDGS